MAATTWNSAWRDGCSWRTTGPMVTKLLITQEFLSLMLCVYRPSVTVVAGVLQRGGHNSLFQRQHHHL